MTSIDPASYAAAAADTEHAHQVALCQWAALEGRHDNRLRMLFAIPNGGERNRVVAARLKAEGVRAGVPDLFLPVPNRFGYHGLFIEMKKPALRPKRGGAGGVSVLQRQWMDALENQGYACVVCYSWDEARNEIRKYLDKSLP